MPITDTVERKNLVSASSKLGAPLGHWNANYLNLVIFRCIYFKHNQHGPDFSACKLTRARTACRAEFRGS